MSATTTETRDEMKERKEEDLAWYAPMDSLLEIVKRIGDDVHTFHEQMEGRGECLAWLMDFGGDERYKTMAEEFIREGRDLRMLLSQLIGGTFCRDERVAGQALAVSLAHLLAPFIDELDCHMRDEWAFR